MIDKARQEGKRWRFRDGKLYVHGESIVADSVQPAVRPVTSMGLSEYYGTDVQTTEPPHQASTSDQPMEQLSQTPNQQVAFQNPHPSYQPEQQNRHQVHGQQQQHQQRQQQDQPRLQQDRPRQEQQEQQQQQQQQLQQDRPWQQQQGQPQQQGQQQQQQLQQHPAPRFTCEPYRHRQPQQPPQAWRQPQSTGVPFVPRVR